MGELTLFILRVGFLVILWAFVFAIVLALRSDLFGQRVRRMPAEAQVAQAPAAAPTPARTPTRTQTAPAAPASANPSAGSRDARRLVITAGSKSGLELDLPAEHLTIGRSSESGLVIRDEYTSTHHARLMLWNDGWVIQDLDSTNGTYLDGARVTVPTAVPLHIPVKIGATSFELRR